MSLPRAIDPMHRGYYWVYRAPLPQLVVMDYREGRSRDGPVAWLDGFEGARQTDGYAAYDAFEHHPAITTYGCWAHARRYFFEAKDSNPEEAAHALAEIAKLYEIERVLREQNAWAAERHVRHMPSRCSMGWRRDSTHNVCCPRVRSARPSATRSRAGGS